MANHHFEIAAFDAIRAAHRGNSRLARCLWSGHKNTADCSNFCVTAFEDTLLKLKSLFDTLQCPSLILVLPGSGTAIYRT